MTFLVKIRTTSFNIYVTLRNVSFPPNVSDTPKRVHIDVTELQNMSSCTKGVKRGVSFVLFKRLNVSIF